MDIKLLTLFVILSVVNVINSTANHIITVKCNKWVASISNAFTYGFYTVVLVYTNSDLPLLAKAITVALANLVGVFIVKIIEEKNTKDKLWKIDCTIYSIKRVGFENALKEMSIPYFYNVYGKHTMFGVFAKTQAESQKVAQLVREFEGKYFINENRGVLY